MSYRVTVQIFAERANFEGLEKTRKRMLPIIGKIGENASDYWENWKPQIVNDPDPDSNLDENTASERISNRGSSKSLAKLQKHTLKTIYIRINIKREVSGL
jgi:hypothetical protein